MVCDLIGNNPSAVVPGRAIVTMPGMLLTEVFLDIPRQVASADGMRNARARVGSKEEGDLDGGRPGYRRTAFHTVA